MCVHGGGVCVLGEVWVVGVWEYGNVCVCVCGGGGCVHTHVCVCVGDL